MSILEKLEGFLNSGQVEVRRKAVTALGEVKSEKGMDYLLAALDDTDSIVRATAIFSLGEIGLERSVEPLLPFLQSDDANIRSGTAVALGKIGSRRAEDALIRALNDPDAYVRSCVASTLAKIGSEKSEKLLVKILREAEEPDSRRKAIIALKEVRTDRVRQAVFDALDDTDESVRNCAAVAVGEIGVQNAEDKLLTLLGKESPDTQISVIFALGEIRSLKAVEAINPFLRAFHKKELAQQAASALGKIASDTAVNELIAVLNAGKPEMTWSVVEALGETRREDVVDYLAPLSQDPQQEVRWSVARALGLIQSKKCLTPLTEMLQDSDGEVRSIAAVALAEMGDLNTVKKLKQLLPTLDPLLAETVQHTIQEIQTRSHA